MTEDAKLKEQYLSDAIENAKQYNILLPTFRMLDDPSLIPEKVKEEKNEVPLKELKQKPKYNIKRLENEISLMEDILEDKRALRYEPEYYQDMKKMAELDDEIDEIHNKIHALEEKWEEAMLFEEEKNK